MSVGYFMIESEWANDMANIEISLDKIREVDEWLKQHAKLTVELVPETAWYTNLRSKLPKEQWDKLRKAAYKKAGHRCDVCGGSGSKWPVECHEIWEYDDLNHTQTLVGLVALCPDCHQVKHLGLAGIQGHGEKAKNHLMAVNRWSEKVADRYISYVFNLWSQRSRFDWQSDVSVLNDWGVSLLEGEEEDS